MLCAAHGELRYICMGEVGGRVILVVYVLRYEKMRMISVRFANLMGRRIYYNAIS